jgi:glutathione peroxidase
MTCVYDFSAELLAGGIRSLGDYRGRPMLIVNTASECGFTGQYAGLEALHEEYAPRGLIVLGFPCNQFGGQEPGNPAEIAEFCTRNFAVDFPMFAKIEVNGAGAHPLFRFLAEAAPGLLGSRRIKWNFTKFLVDREGRPVRRFAPATKPDALRPAIDALLQSGGEAVSR